MFIGISDVRFALEQIYNKSIPNAKTLSILQKKIDDFDFIFDPPPGKILFKIPVF